MWPELRRAVLSNLAFASETDWFAVDSRGYVAILVSNFGPIPAELAWHDENAAAVSARLMGLRASSGITSHHIGLGTTDLVELACRGVFGFAWSDYHGPYLKVVAPNNPICVSALGPMLENFRLPKLAQVDYSAAERLTETDVQPHEWITLGRQEAT
jgi:hypothetical protein